MSLGNDVNIKWQLARLTKHEILKLLNTTLSNKQRSETAKWLIKNYQLCHDDWVAE